MANADLPLEKLDEHALRRIEKNKRGSRKGFGRKVAICPLHFPSAGPKSRKPIAFWRRADEEGLEYT